MKNLSIKTTEIVEMDGALTTAAANVWRAKSPRKCADKHDVMRRRSRGGPPRASGPKVDTLTRVVGSNSEAYEFI